MKGIHILIISILLLLSSCETGNVQPGACEKLVISSGTACGWCAGGDSLLVTKEVTRYGYYSPCDDNDFSLDSVTSPDEWDKLTGLLDMEEFSLIDINTCNVCADGCDTWITVVKGEYSHTVRYGYDDSLTIENIRPFADMLDSIRSSLRNPGL